MIKKEAKELTLEMWEYLYEHPEIDEKKELPKILWDKISLLFSACPICEFFKHKSPNKRCRECPLINAEGCGYYFEWCKSVSLDKRKSAAKVIVDLVKAW